MALLKIYDDEHPSYADGLLEASRIVENFTLIDPTLLRSAASCLEARATTVYEIGFAAGLRLIAEDESDKLRTIPDLQTEIRQRGF